MVSEEYASRAYVLAILDMVRKINRSCKEKRQFDTVTKMMKSKRATSDGLKKMDSKQNLAMSVQHASSPRPPGYASSPLGLEQSFAASRVQVEQSCTPTRLEFFCPQFLRTSRRT